MWGSTLQEDDLLEVLLLSRGPSDLCCCVCSCAHNLLSRLLHGLLYILHSLHSAARYDDRPGPTSAHQSPTGPGLTCMERGDTLLAEGGAGAVLCSKRARRRYPHDSL